MALETKADYARRHGVSKPAVQRWEAKGWLVFENGKVDVEASDANLSKYRNRADGRVPDAGSKPAVNAAWAVNALQPGESPAQAAERIVAMLGGHMSVEEAKRVKENYLALRTRLEYEAADGSLIELSRARQVLFDEARASRDAWLSWVPRNAALIAADLDLDADKVAQALTPYIHKQLESLGAPDGADLARKD